MPPQTTVNKQQTQPGLPVPAQQGPDKMDFLGLLGLLVGAQTDQLGMKLNALQQPQSKIVRKDMAGNVIGPQNPGTQAGLAGWYANNPGYAPGMTYAQGQANQRAMNMSNYAQTMNGLAGLFNQNLKQQEQFAGAGGNSALLPVNPFFMK